jgi:hypothetical protein
MRRTVTAARTLELIRSVGVPEDVVCRLIAVASDVAMRRHSMVLGHRHLLMAAGVIPEDLRRTVPGADAEGCPAQPPAELGG